MKKGIILILITLMLLSLPLTGFAAQNEKTEQDTAVPEAGITPDSWLYGLDNFMKELRLLLTFDAVDKACLLDDISGERLAEAREMVNENKHEYGLVAMKAYKAALEKKIDVLDDAILNNKDIDDILSKFRCSLLTRQELVDAILEEMPEEIREEIEEDLLGTKEDLEVTIEVTDLEGDEEGEESDKDGEEPDSEEDDAVTETEEGNDDDDVDTEEDSEDESETEEPENSVLPLKKSVTVQVLINKIGEDAARLYALGELNLRQLLTVSSLAEQTDRSFEEVLDIFLENGKGIGVTAKALQLQPREALKGIKEVFKGIKCDIKAAFAVARKEVKAGVILPDIDDDQDDVEEDKDDKNLDERDDDYNNNDGRDDDNKNIDGKDNDALEKSNDKDDAESLDDDGKRNNNKNKEKNKNNKVIEKNKNNKSNNGNNGNNGNKKNKNNNNGNNGNKKDNWNKGNGWNKNSNAKNDNKKNSSHNVGNWHKKYQKGNQGCNPRKSIIK
ncbi:MAG TPA: hypothetical protein GXZ37_10795 [Clostridiales bacterium]|nr:hypothetical protein [Clostridiales bacterium]